MRALLRNTFRGSAKSRNSPKTACKEQSQPRTTHSVKRVGVFFTDFPPTTGLSRPTRPVIHPDRFCTIHSPLCASFLPLPSTQARHHTSDLVHLVFDPEYFWEPCFHADAAVMRVSLQVLPLEFHH